MKKTSILKTIIQHPWIWGLTLIVLLQLVVLAGAGVKNQALELLISISWLVVPFSAAWIATYFSKNTWYGLSYMFILPVLGALTCYALDLTGYRWDVPGIQGAVVIFVALLMIGPIPIIIGTVLGLRCARKVKQH